MPSFARKRVGEEEANTNDPHDRVLVLEPELGLGYPVRSIGPRFRGGLDLLQISIEVLQGERVARLSRAFMIMRQR